MCSSDTRQRTVRKKFIMKTQFEQAKYFEKKGCEKIHIVDLDASFRSGKC